MKRICIGILVALPLLLTGGDVQAKVKFGVRGGANLTKISFNSGVWDSKNKTGYFIGPTLKFGMPLGFDLDASALYNQIEADPVLYIGNDNNNDEKFPNLKRKTIAVPLNLRKGFGFGDVLDLFIFAGPQFDFNVNGDIRQGEVEWKWKESTVSVNVGLGLMLLNLYKILVFYSLGLYC